MLKTYKKLGKLFRNGMACTLFAIFASSQLYAQTDTSHFVEEEESKKKMMQEYLEKIHAAGPGVNYQKIDHDTRDKAYKEYLKLNKSKANKRVAAGPLESLAGGKLTGNWNEKGATNMAGNNTYVDYVAATNTLYSTSAGGNVWKGNLNGTGWTCLNNLYKLKGANFIKVVTNGTGKRLVVGTNDWYVYYSDDDGATWIKSTGLENIANWSWGSILKTEMLSDGTIYVLVQEWLNTYGVSVYRSTNKGTSFTKLRSWTASTDVKKYYNLWAPSNTTHTSAYVITKDSIISFPNTGTTITRIAKHNINLTGNDMRFTGVKAGGLIYMYVADSSRVFRSANTGSSWTTHPSPNGTVTRSYGLSTGLNDPNTIYFGNIDSYVGTFNTTNNTISWSQASYWGDYYANIPTKIHADINQVGTFLNAANTEFQLVCSDGGICSSTSKLSSVTNITLTGMNNAQYYSVYTVRTNPNYIYLGAQDQGFQQATADPAGLISVTQPFSGDDGRSVSTDHASFWHTGYSGMEYFPNSTSTANAGYSLNGVGRLWMPFILEHPTNPASMYMGGGKTDADQTVRIYQFTYSAGNITKTNLPFNFRTLDPDAGAISAIGISKLNNNCWYALTDHGKFFYSTTGPNSFTMNTDPAFGLLGGHYFYGSSIVPSKLTLGTVYIAGSGYSSPGVYKSTNHGANFTPITTGLPATLVYDLAINDAETMLFAATEVGPYVYIVADNAWYPMIGTSGTDQIHWDVEYISESSKVRFATYGRGVWDFNIAGSTPVVTITQPLNNATFTAPAAITINANTTGFSSTISKVEFYQGTTKIGEDLTSPYSYAWTAVPAGTYSITAKAINAQSVATTSAPVSVTVTGAQQRVVSITQPLNNATFTAPAAITINATTSGFSSTVSKVEFYQGTTKVGEDLTSPYSYAWTAVPAGTYSITAKATDAQGVVTTSPPISVTVTGQQPVVAITQPTNNAAFTAPASVTINASTSGFSSTISKVEFFQGTTKLGEDLTSPYSYSWTGVGAGTYTLIAKATDAQTIVTTSAAVSITVTGASTTCQLNEAVPSTGLYVVRNDWADQNAGSGVASVTGAMKVTHRAYGQNLLWIIESGKTFNVTSGVTYTIKFDFQDYAGLGISALNAAFATGVSGTGPVLAQSAVSVTGANTSSSYTTKTVNITSTYTGAVSLAIKMNWASQPSSIVTQYLKNISVCPAGTARTAAEETIPSEIPASVFPNPSSEILTVSTTLEEASDLKIELLKNNGTVIKSFFISLAAGTVNLPLNISDLIPGEYLLSLKSEGRSNTIKFIKQ